MAHGNDDEAFESFRIEAGEVGQIRQWIQDETPEYGEYFLLIERDSRGPITFWKVRFLKDSRIISYGERYVLGFSRIINKPTE